jgi:hypothetical protein
VKVIFNNGDSVEVDVIELLGQDNLKENNPEDEHPPRK